MKTEFLYILWNNWGQSKIKCLTQRSSGVSRYTNSGYIQGLLNA
jgi:hypothetical protein